MIIMNLVNVSDYGNSCGFLLCENEELTCSVIQNKVNEIKDKMECEGLDWIIDDILNELPDEWKISLCDNNNVVCI